MSLLQKASLDDIRKFAARICKDYLTGRWKHATADHLTVKRISGGLSNFLYYVSLPEDDPSSSMVVASDDAPTTSHLTDLSGNSTSILVSIADKNRNLNNESIYTEGCENLCVKRQRTESGSIFTKTIEQEPREVLLRIYGQSHGEDALEAMITESVVFALLSERNFGPKLHGIFPGGRIEQYIPARALLTLELSDYRLSMKIAEKMGEIHSLNIPMSKEPDWIWNCIDRWLRSIASTLNRDDWKGAIASHVQEIRSFDFFAEARWLKSIIDENKCPVMFCHNDLQEGNILWRETSDTEAFHGSRDPLHSLRSNLEDSAIVGMDEVSILENLDNTNNDEEEDASKRNRIKKINSNRNNNNQNDTIDLDSTRDSALSNYSEDNDVDLIIIDFEYCAYNYRGFDLANHFLEWTFDYSNPEFPFFFYHKHQYPTKQQRENFIVRYLKKLHEGTNENYIATRKEIDEVENEIRLFSMCSHLFWSLWSVVNTTSNIEFGYWEYAVTRAREYKLLKQEYLNAKSHSRGVSSLD